MFTNLVYIYFYYYFCRAEHLTQTQVIQKESERNLVESLEDWQKVLDDYTRRLDNCDINENVDMKAIDMAVKQLRVCFSS